MDEPRTRRLDVVDARDVDGTPYQAADRAFENLDLILLAADEALDAVDVLALNADMERSFDTKRPVDAAAFLDGLICKRLAGVRQDLAATRRALEVLRRASTFDPGGRLDVAQ